MQNHTWVEVDSEETHRFYLCWMPTTKIKQRKEISFEVAQALMGRDICSLKWNLTCKQISSSNKSVKKYPLERKRPLDCNASKRRRPGKGADIMGE